jgi:hypothetical protein
MDLYCTIYDFSRIFEKRPQSQICFCKPGIPSLFPPKYSDSLRVLAVVAPCTAGVWSPPTSPAPITRYAPPPSPPPLPCCFGCQRGSQSICIAYSGDTRFMLLVAYSAVFSQLLAASHSPSREMISHWKYSNIVFSTRTA